jgi:hypothetical protein
MFTPVRSPLLEEPPSWSILDVARPIGDLDGLTDAVTSWGSGVGLHYLPGGDVGRWRHDTMLTNAAFDDPDIAGIADPAEWPTAIDVQEGGQTVYSAPNGEKPVSADLARVNFRTFSVFTPLLELELAQETGEAADLARDRLRANIAGQIAAEFADSLYTKNPGLYRAATDQSSASPVDPTYGLTVLAEAFGASGTADGSAYGDAVVTAPWHALPTLVKRGSAQWSNGRLLDVFGQPLNVTPGHVLNGPLTDPLDLDSSQPPADAAAWMYISPRPYVGVGSFRPLPTGDERAPGRPAPSGTHAKANIQVGLAEAPAIVVFRPVRVHAVEVTLNEPVGS